MSRRMKLFALVAMLALSARADAGEWQVQPADGSHGTVLTLALGPAVTYRFECAATEVIVTETGVTKLMDMKTGEKIGDDAQAEMPPGSAIMALFAGKGDPRFMPAEAKRNPAGGWDLTIRLPKGDERLEAIGKSDAMSLFTTGITILVKLDDTSRSRWKDFMKHCPAGA